MGEAKVFVAFKIRIVPQLDDAREEVSQQGGDVVAHEEKEQRWIVVDSACVQVHAELVCSQECVHGNTQLDWI